jgi:tetratricopeptide (TPR) repeat protein
VVVPSGVLLAERTLFLPTVGAALSLGAGIAWILDRATAWTTVRRRIASALGAAVLTAGVVRSALRQPVWRNNDLFFDQMLVDAPKSYRSHWIRGLRLFETRDAAGGDKEFATALNLFPNDPALLAQVADRYRASGRCDEAVPLYRQSLVIEPRTSYLRRRMIECLFKADRLDEAREEVARALATHARGARRDSIWVDSLIRLRTKP